MTNLELVLKEEGLLDSFLQKAQKAGMTLVDYLRLASTAALPIKNRGITEEDVEKVDPTVSAVWERMLSDPTFLPRSVRRHTHRVLTFVTSMGWRRVSYGEIDRCQYRASVGNTRCETSEV